MAIAVALLRGSRGPTLFGLGPPAGLGYGLPVVYLAWAAVVLALDPVCRWFDSVKARRRAGWLRFP